LLREVSGYRTLIRYDERGSGLSEREVDTFGAEYWIRDLEAVVERSGHQRFALLGISQGAAIALAYAARHPGRVSAIVLHGGWASGWRTWRDPAVEVTEALGTLMAVGWGSDTHPFRNAFASLFLPKGPEDAVDWLVRMQRASTSPANAVRFLDAFGDLDVRGELGSVEAPVLVTHSARDHLAPFRYGWEMAAAIQGARLVRLASVNHLLLESEPAWDAWRTAARTFLDEVGG
jgi:pimeloyl-ACP methyl ester carboxylesterase